MAITAVNLTSGGSDTGATSYTTASISPGANKLDIVSVTSNGPATVATPTVSGASGTWTQISTVVDSTNVRRTTLFRDLSASPGSGILTLSFGAQTQVKANWSVDEFDGVDTSGTHGSGAIVQAVSTAFASAARTGVTVTLAAFGSSNNAAFGCVRNGLTGAITVGSGFTSLSSVTTATIAATAEWELNNTAVSWTWATQTTVSVAATIEIKAATAAAAALSTPGLVAIQAVAPMIGVVPLYG